MVWLASSQCQNIINESNRFQFAINLINLITCQWLTRFNMIITGGSISVFHLIPYAVEEINPSLFRYNVKLLLSDELRCMVNYCSSFQHLNENWHWIEGAMRQRQQQHMLLHTWINNHPLLIAMFLLSVLFVLNSAYSYTAIFYT